MSFQIDMSGIKPLAPEKQTFKTTEPEDILFKVIREEGTEDPLPSWQYHHIDEAKILNPSAGGAASYEFSIDSSFDELIKACIPCPGEGDFVIEGIMGEYTFTNDVNGYSDNAVFTHSGFRKATMEELAQE